jgi:antitoxin PrlF
LEGKTLKEDSTALAFLGFLEKEIISDPMRLKPFGSEWTRRAQKLVDGMEIDLNEPLAED